MNLLNEIKNYLIYLESIGIKKIPATQEWIKFLKNELFISEDGLDKLKNDILICKKCPLHRIRKQAIWGEGDTNSQLMVISDYPDNEEDFYGKPFVGQIGNLFERMLNAIGLKRENFFITHAVKCKTPGKRPPEKEEIESCKIYLFKQIKYIKPKIILALGFTPPKIFLENNPTFSSIRGKVFKFKNDITVIFTYHPGYILKNPAVKRLVWEDLQNLRKLYEKIFNSF